MACGCGGDCCKEETRVDDAMLSARRDAVGGGGSLKRTYAGKTRGKKKRGYRLPPEVVMMMRNQRGRGRT